ncbi:MAG: hypothetical protein WA347_04250 [Rhabdochlamydiaceae bacterium]|jgi:hypothetical protein
MSNRSPIYDMLHQEIKACADQLLEMSQKQEFSPEKDAEHVLERLNELHKFASKVRSDERYHPLSELKHYLENTMLRYQDEQNQLLSMRLSEAISLLGIPTQTEVKFKPSIVRSLMNHFLSHFREDAKPGRPLFRKLLEIKRI